jgi:hypothetical protein
MRGMLPFILDRHLPMSAVALDRHWNLLLENRAAGEFFSRLNVGRLFILSRPRLATMLVNQELAHGPGSRGSV